MDVYCQICGNRLEQQEYADGKIRVYPCSTDHTERTHDDLPSDDESWRESVFAPDNPGYIPCDCEDYPCCGH